MKPHALIITCLLGLALADESRAEVRIVVGPTPIRDGEATAAGDITLINDKLAATLAVASPAPYGVPRGALVDVAPLVNGAIGRDQLEFADFIPNSWSAWPNTYQKVEIVENGPDRAVVRAQRDWGKVTITTLYTLNRAADHIDIRTTMRNDGEAALTDIHSGLTLWPSGGYFFAVPGLAGVEDGQADSALSDRVVAYDENWFIALHAAYFDRVESGSRDLFLRHSLAPGASREFTGWLQVGPSGDIAPVLRAEIARRTAPSGRLRGRVTSRDGKPVERPLLVIEKQGQLYGWVMGQNGRFEISLPAGEYSAYATARNHSQTATIPLTVAAGTELVRDFRNLQPPGRLRFAIRDRRSREPLDARIAIIKGQKPAVEFLGKRVFFTELDPKGQLDLPIAPGNYEFMVSSDGSFLGPRETIAVKVQPGATQSMTVELTKSFDTRARGWYSADLHHHSDQAEGSTPPADMARAQLAAGLDFLFVSDHDSTANFSILQDIARRRRIGFIPGIELSPSWGHFNAYPLRLDARLSIDISKSTVEEILGEGRRMGAIAIQANHPFIPYGYLTSAANGVVPGGFSRGFDLLEINLGSPNDDQKVLARLWQHWNAGERVFLTAGSDTHDAWNDESGRVRVFAQVNGEPDASAFVEALRNGRAYVSFGPLIFPSVTFGERLRVKPGEPFKLNFELRSTAGLRRVELVSGGATIKTENFEPSAQNATVEFPLRTDASTWYALVVRDRAGRKAYTNPIWIDVIQ